VVIKRNSKLSKLFNIEMEFVKGFITP